MKRRAILARLSVLALAGSCLIATTPAFAQDGAVSRFYRGKQVTLFIGSAVGGGYDAYGRLLARYIGNHIPGRPQVVPMNMPGASGLVLVSHLLTAAPRDGTAIAAIQPDNVIVGLLTDKKGVPSQGRNLVYLGSAEFEDALCWVRHDAEVTSFPQIFSKSLLIGASAPGGYSYNLPTVENAILGTKFKIVSGYAGVNEVLLAVDRNEVHGVCGVGAAALMTQRPNWLSSGFIKILVQENSVGRPQLNAAGVPRTVDFAKTPQDRRALDLVYSEQQFGRPFVMPPDAPAERVAALRRAFLDVLHDPQLLAEAKRTHLEIGAMPGEQLQGIVDDLYRTPAPIVARAKLAMSGIASKKRGK